MTSTFLHEDKRISPDEMIDGYRPLLATAIPLAVVFAHAQ
jgi:hypothetical protein